MELVSPFPHIRELVDSIQSNIYKAKAIKKINNEEITQTKYDREKAENSDQREQWSHSLRRMAEESSFIISDFLIKEYPNYFNIWLIPITSFPGKEIEKFNISTVNLSSLYSELSDLGLYKYDIVYLYHKNGDIDVHLNNIEIQYEIFITNTTNLLENKIIPLSYFEYDNPDLYNFMEQIGLTLKAMERLYEIKFYGIKEYWPYTIFEN